MFFLCFILLNSKKWMMIFRINQPNHIEEGIPIIHLKAVCEK